MMKPLLLLCVLIVIFEIIFDRSEANEICRCDNRLGIGGGWRTGKATQQCGQDKFKFHCFTYDNNIFCEVGNAKSEFEKCCVSYDVVGVVGAKCQKIK